MDQLSALKTLVLVADGNGFTRAARETGQSKSAASRQIAALEEQLGVQLFKRSTRTVALTEAGYAYLERARAILADLDEAGRAVAALHTEPRGTLKINAPMSFGVSHVAPAIAAFMVKYPDLKVALVLNDRPVDPYEEGFDVTLRIGKDLADSSLAARRLASVELGLMASPDYLAKAGRPRAPEDLGAHAALHYGNPGPGPVWRMRGGAGEAAVPIRERLCSNNGDVLRIAALDGLGITLLPLFFVREDLKAGRLLQLLDGFEPKALSLYALYPPTRFLAAKTRVFIDFLANRFKSLPI
jgi:DNA-binding transcriptional LysR family regulator